VLVRVLLFFPLHEFLHAPAPARHRDRRQVADTPFSKRQRDSGGILSREFRVPFALLRHPGSRISRHSQLMQSILECPLNQHRSAAGLTRHGPPASSYIESALSPKSSAATGDAMSCPALPLVDESSCGPHQLIVPAVCPTSAATVVAHVLTYRCSGSQRVGAIGYFFFVGFLVFFFGGGGFFLLFFFFF